MTYDEFKAELKAGLPKRLYVFVGAEEFLKESCAGLAKKKLVDGAFEEFNFQSYSEAPDFTQCNSFVNTLPMMSERKLLVLRRCGFFERNLKQKSDWEAMLADLPEYICVILWEGEPEKGKKKPSSPIYKVCEKVGAIVDFQLQTESKLIPWVAKIAMSGGKLIDKGCASYIISSMNRSMSAIKTEMQKINAYAEGEQITRADIDAVIVKPAEDKVFKLADAIMEGRRDLCYGYLYELNQNRTEPVAFLSMFSGQLLTIYRARLLLNEGFQGAAAAKRLGGGWAAEKSVRTASKTNEAKLERLIALCQNADKSIKQGRSEPWAALEIVVAEMKI